MAAVERDINVAGVGDITDSSGVGILVMIMWDVWITMAIISIFSLACSATERESTTIVEKAESWDYHLIWRWKLRHEESSGYFTRRTRPDGR